MAITFETRKGTCLLALAGEFDRTNVDDLAAAAQKCLESAPSLVLGFRDVTFVDAGVLSLLHDVLDGLESRGWLGIVEPIPGIRRLLDVSGLSRRRNLRLFSTMAEAVSAIDEN